MVRGVHPATPSIPTAVDTYPDVVKCASPIPLDEPPYTITAERNPYVSDLESLIVPPSKTLPPKRPLLPQRLSSNLVTRWNRVDVPDSVLIAELGELRKSVELANGDLQSGDGHGLVSESWCNSCTYGSSPEDGDQRWRKAQKSAFCRRELIKTELSYLEGILQLENKDVSELETNSRRRCSLPTDPIAATHPPPSLPSIFNCCLLPATRPFSL